MPMRAIAPTPPTTPPTMAPTGVLLFSDLFSLVGCVVLLLPLPLLVVELVRLEVGTGTGAPEADPDFELPEADPVTVYLL